MIKYSFLKYRFLVIFTLLSRLFFDSKVFAAFTDNLGGSRGEIFTVQMLFNIIRSLACRFIQFGIIAVGIAMVIYGLLFIKSRGNAAEMTNAKQALTWGVVGGLVIFGVFTIILTVGQIIGGIDYPKQILSIITCPN